MVLILINLVFAATQEDLIVISLDYDKGNISLSRFSIEKGFFNDPIQPDGGYKIELRSCDKILYEQKFNFPLEVRFVPPREWFDEEGNQIYIPDEEEVRITIDTASVELYFPYFENYDNIKVYDADGNEVLNEKVSSRKCRAEEVTISDEEEVTISDEEEVTISDEEEKLKGKIQYNIIIGILLALIISIIIWVVVRFIKQ